MSKKKTLYEILAVSPDASSAEIEVGYQKTLEKLQSKKDGMDSEDYDFNVRVIQVARNTLADQASRDVYDAKLSFQQPSQHSKAPVHALTVRSDEEATLLRAEAMSLRADALSLKADAISIRAGSPMSITQMLAQNVTPQSGPGLLLKKAIFALGAVVAVIMVVQVITMFLASRRMAIEDRAQERVMQQEHNQTYGVRSPKQVEAELLEAENRRLDNEKRAAATEKRKQEEDAKQFERDARRRAAEVSAELRYSEEAGRRQAQEEERRLQYEKERKQEMESRKVEAEQNRIERQQKQWQDIIKR